MRINTNDPIWVVIDPASDQSIFQDICFQTTLAGLELQYKGGLSSDENPTIFTEREEAEEEAKKRLGRTA